MTGLRPTVRSTAYGFIWYPEDAESVIQIERVATLNGRVVLRLSAFDETDLDMAVAELEITVSRKGRVIRTYPTHGNVGEYQP